MQTAAASSSPAHDADLFVIGGGSGGVRAARRAAALGARVVLAEAGALGGTCVNVGCIPKKLYSYAAGYAEAFAEAPGYGWTLPQAPRFDWDRLKARRAAEIARLNGVYRKLLDDAGVQVVPGWARLVDGHTVEVSGRRHRAAHILVATGGVPRAPTLPGGEHAVVSDALFDLPRFPRRLAVVGSGYIACEFASIFNGLGAQVTLLLRRDHVLGRFDADVQRVLAQELAKTGIEIRTQCAVERLSRDGDDVVVGVADAPPLRADTVLYAIGRVPRTAGLGADAAGLALNAQGAVVVDAHYRSSLPSVYAVGDVSSAQQLTPVALAEAMMVVDRLFGAAAREIDYDYIPSAVFTHPAVGSCGCTEAQARDRFGGVRVFATEFKPLRHTLSGRSERCFMKLVVDAARDRVVGLHMVGPEAGEIVQGFAVAMNAGATKAQFDRTLGIHPTLAEEFVTMREPLRG